MTYSQQEAANLKAIESSLDEARDDFSRFFEKSFIDDVEWTIAGHGPVAGTYRGMKQLWDDAEAALYDRLAEPLTIEVIGLWADGDQVFARIQSASKAIDGQPYANEYMYIMTVRDGMVVSGIEWLDLNAYYEIVDRIHI